MCTPLLCAACFGALTLRAGASLRTFACSKRLSSLFLPATYHFCASNHIKKGLSFLGFMHPKIQGVAHIMEKILFYAVAKCKLYLLI